MIDPHSDRPLVGHRRDSRGNFHVRSHFLRMCWKVWRYLSSTLSVDPPYSKPIKPISDKGSRSTVLKLLPLRDRDGESRPSCDIVAFAFYCRSRNVRRFERDCNTLLYMFAKFQGLREKIMGYLAASKRFSVPRSTLFDYVRSNSEPTKAVKSKLGRKPILPASLEDKLVDYVLMMERKYFG
ncbi:hypothetical protein ANN_22846 [Periplaneta americana]|uniref:HTH psq-type domain-containing protein n=1 Tax=Periplaneta americana TaxID=6978 RepID=A0ABQ8SJG1_PERAM|nr:hypothetical protein ANN_22846 [Periplaneta americana]